MLVLTAQVNGHCSGETLNVRASTACVHKVLNPVGTQPKNNVALRLIRLFGRDQLTLA